MKRTERIRLYPTASQVARLEFALDVTRQLYNALLEERREAFRRRGVPITTKQQYAELTALRREDARIAAVYRECEDAVLHRLDLAFQGFFRRIKRGEKPGYPRFRSASRWNQLEYPHGNRALRFNAAQTKVVVPEIGCVRLRKGRSVPAFGRAWIVRENGRWYASFECERKARVSERNAGVLGPRAGEKHRRKLERAQRAVTRKKRGGKNRRKAVARLARAHERVSHSRKDALHKIARRIVDSAPATIAVEALNLRGMTRSARGTIEEPGKNVRAKAALNRALLDASFGLLQRMIAAKAEEAGLAVVAVDPRYSSQECSRCGRIAAESRARRRYRCVACGFSTHADVNAALVIARRAQLGRVGRGGALAHFDDRRRVPDAGAEPVTQHEAAKGIHNELNV